MSWKFVSNDRNNHVDLLLEKNIVLNFFVFERF